MSELKPHEHKLWCASVNRQSTEACNCQDGQDPIICPACEIAVSGTLPNKRAFYDADPGRQFTPEADYGNFWIEQPGSRFPLWRVTYNGRGDVFATELGGSGRIKVLGYFPPDPGAKPGVDKWYVGLDGALQDWAEESGRPLSWVQDRIDFGHNNLPGICERSG